MVRELVRSGTTVWDIGANVGLFSFAAAAKGAQVVAVEADTWLASLLHRSVHLNGLPVTVVPAAVSSVPGIATLSQSDQGKASNSLQGNGPRQTVVTITLDWLAEHFPAPHVLKIDVEGMEYEVLRGGGTLLHRHHPAIFCEVTQNHDSVGHLLMEAGYTMYAARAQTRHPLNRPSYDTLAL
jgi:FkbM family methyltransferase